jgi:hypothetical protein
MKKPWQFCGSLFDSLSRKRLDSDAFENYFFEVLMKLACSMRLGGELIAAAECNHEDFQRHKPLCPNCKEPVFLRTGGNRRRGETVYQVESYWSHFATKDPTLARAC